MGKKIRQQQNTFKLAVTKTQNMMNEVFINGNAPQTLAFIFSSTFVRY